MPFSLGSAFYRIGVDNDGLKRGLRESERDVKGWSARVSKTRANVRAGLDDSEFDRKMRELDRRIAVWEKRRANAHVGAATEEANRKLDQLLAKKRLLSSQKAKIEVEVDRDIEPRINRITNTLISMNRRGNETRNIFQRVGDALHNVRVEMGPFSLSMRGLVVAFAALAPIISSTVGVLGAFAASLSAAAVGAVGLGAALGTGLLFNLGAVFAVVKPMAKDLGNLMDAQDAYNKAVREHGKDSEEAAKKLTILHNVQKSVGAETTQQRATIRDLGKRWRELTEPSRAEFFDLVDHSLQRLNRRLPVFADLANESFVAASKGARTFVDALSGRGNTRNIEVIMRQTNGALGPLSQGFSNLATVVLRVFRSFSYHFVPFAEGFENWTEDLLTATGNAGQLNRVVDQLVSNARTWGGIMYQTSRLVLGFFRAAIPEGNDMAKSLEGTVKVWADWMNSDRGQNRTRAFLRDSRDLVTRIWRAVQPLMGVWFDVATAMRPMVGHLVDILGMAAKLTDTFIDLTGGAKGLVTVMAGFYILRRALGWTAELYKLLTANKLLGALSALRGGGGFKAVLDVFGDRGTTPANPLFVEDVTGGGVPGRPGGKGPGPVTPVGKIGGKLLPILRGAGIAGFVIAGSIVASELLGRPDRSPDTGHHAGGRGEATERARRNTIERLRPEPLATNASRAAVVEVQKLERASRRAQRTINDLNLFSAASLKDLSQTAAKNLRQIKDDIGLNTEAGKRLAASNFKALARQVAAAMGDGRTSTRSGMREILSQIRTHSGNSKDIMKKNFDAAEHAIRESMRKGVISTRRGLRLIEELMAQELSKTYGVSIGEARASVKQERDRLDAHKPYSTVNAKGGMHQYGRAGQTGLDSIQTVIAGRPARVAPGEVAAVFTKHQQRIVNERLADFGGLPGFFDAVDTPHAQSTSRYASGGWVGQSPAGLNPAARSVAQWAMNRFGAVASSTVRPGSGSFHNIGAAVDLVSGNMLQMGLGIANAFGPRLAELIHTPMGFSIDNGRRTAPFAQADHYDHVHEAALGKALIGGMGTASVPRIVVGGPASTMRTIQQGQMDAARAAANQFLEQTGAGMMGGDVGMATGPWANVMRQIAQSRGWSFSDWMWIVQHESGGRPGVYNSSGSGAFGLGQLMPGTYATYGGGPGSSPAEQIAAMASYIAARYGTPSRARAFWQANNWYQTGGIAFGDPLPGGMEAFQEAGGERVRRRNIRREQFGPTKGDPPWLRASQLAPWRIMGGGAAKQFPWMNNAGHWKNWQERITMAEARASRTNDKGVDDKKVRGYKREGLTLRERAVKHRIHIIQSALRKMPSMAHFNRRIKTVEGMLARKGKGRVKGDARKKLEEELKNLKQRKGRRVSLQGELHGRRSALTNLWTDISGIDADIAAEAEAAAEEQESVTPEPATVSADELARANQEIDRLRIGVEAGRISSAAFATLTGASDLGYSFGPLGQSGAPGGISSGVSVASSMSRLSSPLGGGSLGGGGATVVNISALYPSDPATYAAIAQTAASAFGQQGYVSNSRVNLGI